MKCLIQLTGLMIKSITWLLLLVLIYDPIASAITQKLLRSSSKFLSPHSNDILIATRNPECDDSRHQTKILILPVFVPHSRKEPEVEIMSMDRFNPSSYSFKSKKGKKNHWKESQGGSSNDDRETQFSLAKFLENPKSNYILGNDIDLSQAGLLASGKFNEALLASSGDESNSRGGGEGLTLSSGGSGDGSELNEGKMPLLTELIVKSVLAGQKNLDWDYVSSNASPTHTSPDTTNSTNHSSGKKTR